MAHQQNGQISPLPAKADTRKTTLIADGKRVHSRPEAQGLYDPTQEHDACGIGMIANIKNKPSHEVVEKRWCTRAMALSKASSWRSG